MNTTDIMKAAIAANDGKIGPTIEYAKALTHDHPDAWRAVRILRRRAVAGAKRFIVTRSGFITVEKADG
jgi:hypothetical protein